MRLGMLTQYYPPEMGAPQARLSELARRFVDRGHEVHVLTAMPSYPRGAVYPGYGGFHRHERIDGVSVDRAFAYPTKSVRVAPRLFSYFSFVGSSLITGAAALPELDFLLTESPPLFLGISGYVLSAMKRARFIFNVSDLWPESAVRLGVIRDGVFLRAAEELEARCYRAAWLVTGQSRGILENIRARFPGVETYHLSNGVDTALFGPERRSAEVRKRLLGDVEDGCLAIYAGLHGVAQGLDQIVDLAARVRDLEKLRIVLVGDGPEKERLIRRAREVGAHNIRFLDPVRREEMPALVASADISLVPLGVHLPGAVPSKLYEAMGSGVATLLVAGGEPAEILAASRAGLAVKPSDPGALEAALRSLVSDPALRARFGEAGRRAAVASYDRERIAAGFIDHLAAR